MGDNVFKTHSCLHYLPFIYERFFVMDNPTATTTAPLSVLDVVSPSVSFGDGVLARAKELQRDAAREDLLTVAQAILSATRGELGRLESTIAQLNTELAKLNARRDVIAKASAYADHEPNKGLFALAATVGQKVSVLAWCQKTGVVAPANDDAIWTIPGSR